jgi:hypothetical protein
VRNGRVEVLTGLKAGENVVERGAGFLKDGDTVRVVASDAPEMTSVTSKPGSGGNT